LYFAPGLFETGHGESVVAFRITTISSVFSSLRSFDSRAGLLTCLRVVWKPSVSWRSLVNFWPWYLLYVL
jgi:hypothetical protein